MELKLWFYVVALFALEAIVPGYSVEISSKLEFDEEPSNSKKSDDVEIIDGSRYYKSENRRGSNDEASKESIDEDEIKTITVKGKSEKLTDKDIVCNSNKCLVEIENTSSNKRKTSTDIHVKISTASEDNIKSDNKKADSDEYDVPVIKGYASVKPQDLPKENREDNGVQINVPGNNPNIVKSRDPDAEMPMMHLIPPKFHPNNWHDYLDSKTEKTPARPTVYHTYNVGDPHRDHNNYIPSGWSSSWKPISPSFQNPGDYYHYNVNNKERGFADMAPQYFNYCTCTRKPGFPLKPVTPRPHNSRGFQRPVHPWFSYETTTKMVLDDKLPVPFSTNTKGRRYD